MPVSLRKPVLATLLWVCPIENIGTVTGWGWGEKKKRRGAEIMYSSVGYTENLSHLGEVQGKIIGCRGRTNASQQDKDPLNRVHRVQYKKKIMRSRDRIAR